MHIDDNEFLKSLAARIDTDLEDIFQGNFVEANFYNTELKIRQFIFEAEGTTLDKFAKQYSHILLELTDNNHSVLKYYLTRSPLRESLQDDLKWHLAVLKWAGTDMTFATFEEYVHRLIRHRDLRQVNTVQNITEVSENLSKGLSIRFIDNVIVEKSVSFLSAWFDNADKTDLQSRLAGNTGGVKLVFNGNKNKFVDFFWRLRIWEPPLLLSNPSETTDWICNNFKARRPGSNEPEEFNWKKVNKIVSVPDLNSYSEDRCQQPLGGIVSFFKSI